MNESTTPISSSNLLSPQSGQDRLKQTLLSYHSQTYDNKKRIDVSKIVEEYQTKFKVPKVLIIQWLGLKCQSSQFKNAEPQSIESSFITEANDISNIEDLELSKRDDMSVSMTDGEDSQIILLKAKTTKEVNNPLFSVNCSSTSIIQRCTSSHNISGALSPLKVRKSSIIRIKKAVKPKIPKQQVTKLNDFLKKIEGSVKKASTSKKRLMFKTTQGRSEETKDLNRVNSGLMTSRQFIPRKLQSDNVVIPQDLYSHKAASKVVQRSRQAQLNRIKTTLPDLSNSSLNSKMFSPRKSSIKDIYSPVGSRRNIKSPLRHGDRSTYLDFFSTRRKSNNSNHRLSVNDMFSPISVRKNNYIDA